MEDSTQAAFERVKADADELRDEVDNAFEEHATFAIKLATKVKVIELGKLYRELLGSLSTDDRLLVERTIGRKVMDVERMAIRLPSPPEGNPAEKAVDSGILATREGKSSRQPITIGAQPGGPRRGEAVPRFRVTGEVESWCGPCEDMRTHVIIAMLGEVPAQVVCQSCGGRHKFRERRPVDKKPAAARASYAPVSYADPEAQRRSREKQALVTALNAAENVRSYAPKERYKVGEIIAHPEHGRGKIENTLPRSLLVRFASGLKTVKLT